MFRPSVTREEYESIRVLAAMAAAQEHEPVILRFDIAQRLRLPPTWARAAWLRIEGASSDTDPRVDPNVHLDVRMLGDGLAFTTALGPRFSATLYHGFAAAITTLRLAHPGEQAELMLVPRRSLDDFGSRAHATGFDARLIVHDAQMRVLAAYDLRAARRPPRTNALDRERKAELRQQAKDTQRQVELDMHFIPPSSPSPPPR